MLDSNWYIIDGLLFGDFKILENILMAFINTDDKRILFSHYFSDLDDCDEEEDYTKSDFINDGFEYYKSKADPTFDYEKLSIEIKEMLYKEYCRLLGHCDESVKEDLCTKFLNGENDSFDEEYIYSIKEYIAREFFKPNKEIYSFINERKVLENNTNPSFTKSNFYSEGDKKYVWYEPKSKDDLFTVLEESSYTFCCIITEDINNFDNYLYTFELFEEGDFLLAINDRVGNFESDILPKVGKFLTKENTVLSEKEYLKRFFVD